MYIYAYTYICINIYIYKLNDDSSCLTVPPLVFVAVVTFPASSA